MSSLADHYDDAGSGGGDQWLRPGWHTVTVESYKCGTSDKKGTQFVEFMLANQAGAKRDARFYLTEPAAKILAGFAKACGMSKQDMLVYHWDNPQCHSLMVNKTVQVLVEKEGKYHNVTDWAPIGATVTTPQPEPAGAYMPTSDSEVPF